MLHENVNNAIKPAGVSCHFDLYSSMKIYTEIQGQLALKVRLFWDLTVFTLTEEPNYTESHF
jgi:hypothetical protein